MSTFLLAWDQFLFSDPKIYLQYFFLGIEEYTLQIIALNKHIHRVVIDIIYVVGERRDA